MVPENLWTPLDSARRLLVQAKRPVALTGAGMSAESGIPTFRQAQDGLWSRYRPAELATVQAWRRDPALVWGWYLWRMARVRDAAPNAGHRALAEWAGAGMPIITQNVDDLHERAGSRGVVHLHGGLFAHRCFACARPHAEVMVPAAAEVPERIEPPRCRHCGGRIRPGVVWFGENLPAVAMDAASTLAVNCDLMLVIGTSAVVQPAASLPEVALRHGAKLVEINPHATDLSPIAQVCVRAGAAEVLPQVLAAS